MHCPRVTAQRGVAVPRQSSSSLQNAQCAGPKSLMQPRGYRLLLQTSFRRSQATPHMPVVASQNKPAHSAFVAQPATAPLSRLPAWSTWAGLTLTAYVGVDTVEIVGPDGCVMHPRQRFGRHSIDYRHYIPELARKPQALRQVAAKLLPRMDERFGKAWAHLVDAHGPKQASRVMAQVLKAVVANGETAVAQRLELALLSGEAVQLAVRCYFKGLACLERGFEVDETVSQLVPTSGTSSGWSSGNAQPHHCSTPVRAV